MEKDEQRQAQMMPQTCQHCRWFKRVPGDFLLEETRTRIVFARNPEICTARPPKAGRDYPLSFAETDAACSCSQWQAMPDAGQ